MIDSIKDGRDDSKINIVITLCDTDGSYARHVAVVMASVFANTKHRVAAYIVHDGTLSAENERKLEQTAEMSGQKAHIINAEKTLAEKRFDTGKLGIGGNRGKLLKLLLPELIDVHKIIFFDCDIIVNLDLYELWSIDMKGRSIAAAHDIASLDRCGDRYRSWRKNSTFEIMGFDTRYYFNSGVMMMDLDKIRKREDFLGEAAVFYKKYKKATTLTDQDCFNFIFGDDVVIVDERFNRIDFSDIAEDERSFLPCIWHLAGTIKPWMFYTKPGIDEFYWHYLTMTPWGAEKEDLISAMLHMFQTSNLYHMHSKDCLTRLRKQMADNIFRAHLWMMPRIILMKFKQKKQRKLLPVTSKPDMKQNA